MKTTPADRFPWERAFRGIGRKPWAHSSTVAVGFYLATWSNADGGSIFPGVEKTAADLGMSESTVKRALSALKRHGWIVEVRAAVYRKGLATEYRLTLPGERVQSEDKRSPMTSHQITNSSLSTPSTTPADPDDAFAREMAKMEKRKQRDQAEADERLRRDLMGRQAPRP